MKKLVRKPSRAAHGEANGLDWRPSARLRTQEGHPNKITREIKEIAHQYGPGALKELARIATQGESEAARVAACREILDRAYGKAMQPIQGTVDYGISEQLAELFRGNEGNTLGAEIARRALPAPNGQQPH
jgi:hypothetical protein